jgi:uncharacterized membrane protein
MSAKSCAVATAVALMFISHGFVARADSSVVAAQVRCFGINNCRGQSFCATAKNACAGQNACKGQGWLRVSRQDVLRGEAVFYRTKTARNG